MSDGLKKFFCFWRGHAEEKLGGTCEDGRVVWANCHEEAAEIWAQQEDSYSNEYWIVQGAGATVEVKEKGSLDAPKKFAVYGKQSINYYAKEIKPAEVKK